MFAITLCKFTRYDQNRIFKVYMTPLELSCFTDTQTGKKQKYQEIS